MARTVAATGPNFDASVSALNAAFAVLVGLSITDFLDPTKTKIPGKFYWWMFVILISLLLRFIVGSAIHLKYMYGARLDAAGKPKGPRSRAVLLFFKDGAFLVWSGALAVGITHSSTSWSPGQQFDLHPFIMHAELFLGAALLWSIVDWLARLLYSSFGAKDEWPESRPWLVWGAVDGLQLLLTWAIGDNSGTQLTSVQVLAVLYVVFLIFDFGYSVRSLRD